MTFYASKIIKQREAVYNVAKDPLLNDNQKLRRMAWINVWEQMDRLKCILQTFQLMDEKKLLIKGYVNDKENGDFQEVKLKPVGNCTFRMLSNQCCEL